MGIFIYYVLLSLTAAFLCVGFYGLGQFFIVVFYSVGHLLWVVFHHML